MRHPFHIGAAGHVVTSSKPRHPLTLWSNWAVAARDMENDRLNEPPGMCEAQFTPSDKNLHFQGLTSLDQLQSPTPSDS